MPDDEIKRYLKTWILEDAEGLGDYRGMALGERMYLDDVPEEWYDAFLRVLDTVTVTTTVEFE